MYYSFSGTTCYAISHPRFEIPMLRAFRICGQFFWDIPFHKIRLGRTVYSEQILKDISMSIICSCTSNSTFYYDHLNGIWIQGPDMNLEFDATIGEGAGIVVDKITGRVSSVELSVELSVVFMSVVFNTTLNSTIFNTDI